jgi:hypothetical protein
MIFEDDARAEAFAHRDLLTLKSSVSAALRELEPFVDRARRDDLVLAAQRAKKLYVEERQLNDEQTRLLIAISEALLPFSRDDGDATLVDKVRKLVERWQFLEKEMGCRG